MLMLKQPSNGESVAMFVLNSLHNAVGHLQSDIFTVGRSICERIYLLENALLHFKVHLYAPWRTHNTA